jgi:chromosome segregation protein
MTDQGAHFYRCDFQVHTPRDSNWSGKRATTDEERLAFARSLVAECRQIKLDAIAITDHHDFVMYPYIRQAALEETNADGELLPENQRLIVFPGLELTLGVPCQALLILDADFPLDRLDDILTTLSVQKVDASVSSLPAVEVIAQQSLLELHRTLSAQAWLKDRYIVFPNVTDGGHKSLMRSGMGEKYKEMPCVGGYLDGSVSSIGEGNQKIFAGQDGNYGNKRLAVIQTSDSRREDFRELGKHSSWIKWSRPTAEALRQACLAHESRITHSRPELPGVWLSRVSVDASMFLGPIELELNPQFNAIIGGRGTGKSTLLDYVRWALCDQPASVQEDEELADPIARQRRLISATLAPLGASVEVHFSLNEIAHVVRRNSSSGELLLKVGQEEFRRVTEADIRELLPIQAYSQKQLSSVSVRLAELTRFVEAPIRRDLTLIDQRIRELAGRIRENYATLQRRRELDVSIRRLELSGQSLGEQATNLRQSFENLSDVDQTILSNKPGYDRVRSTVDVWEDVLTRGLDAGDRALAGIRGLSDGVAPSGDIPEEIAEQLTTFEAEARKLLEDAESSIAAVLAELRSALDESSAHEERVNALRASIATFEETYAAVKLRSNAQETRLAELAEIEQQQQQTANSVRVQRTELQGLGDPESAHVRLIHGLFELMADRSDCMAQRCETLSTLSAGLLRATLRRGQGLGALVDRFRGAVAGSNLRGERVQALFDGLRDEENPLATWEAVLGELERLSWLDPDAEVTSERFPTISRLGVSPQDLKRISSRLTADGWLSLALEPVADHPHFEFRVKEEEYIEFSSASPGQQATALLRVLLAQTGPPLIIDQPEDDLDSEVVQDVVEQIWEAKKHRQLIFSSHNANVVVNGDAELVVHCDYKVGGEQSRGEIKNQGAIDLATVRTAITRVMEGGEKAFKLRKEKYGF